ncbi:MAG: D-alanyl-D-alanine carboxypeptidase/D-alanyl-D-alanine-endopeptidase [Gemmatimonadales bacterium]
MNRTLELNGPAGEFPRDSTMYWGSAWPSRVRHHGFAIGWLACVLGTLLGSHAVLSAQLPRNAVRQLDSLLDAPPFNRLLWGVALVDETGRLLYGRNADRLFIPASNTKLVVSAVAATMLPPDWTIATSVYSTAAVRDHVLEGDLVLYGRGDPTFGRRCYATDTTVSGVCDTDPFARLRDLAQALVARGITSVAGDIVGDGSWFQGELTRGDWNSEDLNWWYAAPVSGLGFNDNSVDITWQPGTAVDAPAQLHLEPDLGDITLENRTRTVAAGGESDIGDRMYREPGTLHLWAEGTVALDHGESLESFALPDPDRFAATAFRRALTEAGISVTGTTRSTTDSLATAAARQLPPLAETTSRPLHDWIFPILNTSQNWYAEMLLKQLGRQFGTSGSWTGGLAVERQVLVDSMGIDSTLFSLADGSGLSAKNLVAPLAFTRLLQYVRHRPGYATFSPGLPRSGNTGSLKRRFIGTPIEGRVWAKTGSIARVNTLSGYIELPGRTLAFSVQANHHVLGGRQMLAQIDSIVVALAKAAGKLKK